MTIEPEQAVRSTEASNNESDQEKEQPVSGGKLWIWSLNNWTRSLRPRDIEECITLQNLLKNVCISMEDEDELIWSPCKSGIFSVKSFTSEIAKTVTSSNQVDLGHIWRGLVPPRIEIFAWLAWLGKLNSRAKLATINIIPLYRNW